LHCELAVLRNTKRLILIKRRATFAKEIEPTSGSEEAIIVFRHTPYMAQAKPYSINGVAA
jgi:hypothetical protein